MTDIRNKLEGWGLGVINHQEKMSELDITRMGDVLIHVLSTLDKIQDELNETRSPTNIQHILDSFWDSL